MRKISAIAVAFFAIGCRDEHVNAGAAQQTVIRAPTAEVPPLNFKSGATWGDGAVEYLGSNISPQYPNAGDDVVVQHAFVARRAPLPALDLFVHIIDAQSREYIGQMDHPFQNGAAPTQSWQVGLVMVDELRFKMPDSSRPLQLLVGFFTPNGRTPGDRSDKFFSDNRAIGPILAKFTPAPIPTYEIFKAKKPPTIDGNLNDPVWTTAPVAKLVRSFEGTSTTRATTFRMLWDDAFIYVGFDAEDSDVWGTLRNHDDAIYTEEAVEVFFDADGDGATYNELEVSPRNVTFDAEFVTRRSDLPTAIKWESGMVSAVAVRGTLDNPRDTDKGWTTEMKIPIAKLTHIPHIPPQEGDVWRFNAYRLEHLKRGSDVEGQAYSPVFVGDFHNLQRFAQLRFSQRETAAR